MAPRPKNPIKDVGKLLGGAAKGVQNWSESQARTFTNPYINIVGKTVGKNPNLPTSGFREAASNTAFAAVDVASPAIGRGAAKVVGKVVQRVVPGVAARRSLNKSGDVLFLHGSDTQNIKKLQPTKQNVVDADDRWRPPVLTFGQRAHFPREYVSPSPRTPKDLVSRGIIETREYATDSYSREAAEQPGSIYVARTSKSSIRNPDDLKMDFMTRDPNWVHVKSPSEVVSEIKLTPDLLANRKALEAKVRKELRRAGARVPKKK